MGKDPWEEKKADGLGDIFFRPLAQTGPGGYLQWEEADILDQYATPPTPVAQETIQLLLREKLARGLTLW